MGGPKGGWKDRRSEETTVGDGRVGDDLQPKP